VSPAYLILSMETTNMSNINLLIADANPALTFLKVTFPGSNKQYTYKTIEDIKEGDSAVVDAPSGLTVVNVVEAIPAVEYDMNFGFPVKWVVQKIDCTNYERCVQMERQVRKQLSVLQQVKQRKEFILGLEQELGKDGIDAVKKLVRL
jgi:hypothetical protein